MIDWVVIRYILIRLGYRERMGKKDFLILNVSMFTILTLIGYARMFLLPPFAGLEFLGLRMFQYAFFPSDFIKHLLFFLYCHGLLVFPIAFILAVIFGWFFYQIFPNHIEEMSNKYDHVLCEKYYNKYVGMPRSCSFDFKFRYLGPYRIKEYIEKLTTKLNQLYDYVEQGKIPPCSPTKDARFLKDNSTRCKFYQDVEKRYLDLVDDSLPAGYILPHFEYEYTYKTYAVEVKHLKEYDYVDLKDFFDYKKCMNFCNKIEELGSKVVDAGLSPGYATTLFGDPAYDFNCHDRCENGKRYLSHFVTMKKKACELGFRRIDLETSKKYYHQYYKQCRFYLRDAKYLPSEEKNLVKYKKYSDEFKRRMEEKRQRDLKVFRESED